MTRPQVETSAVAFFRPGSQPFGTSIALHCENELTAGLASARWCRDACVRAGAVAFGYPGNGARSYARRLCHDLSSETFHVAWVDTRAITLSPAPVLRSSVQRLEALLYSESLRPLVTVMDDLDSVGPAERDNPLASEIRRPLSSCATGYYPAPLLLLATAAEPNAAMAPLSPLPTFLTYLPWPDVDSIRALIQAGGIPHAAAVAERVWEGAKARKVRHTVDGITNAVHQALRMADGPNAFEHLHASEIATILAPMCNPIAEDTVAEYEQKHGDHIEAARASRQHWCNYAPS